jgi:hypothetical protein
MYLAMEEWFHDHNDKEEVRRSRDEIAKVLTSLQKFFPRKDNSNGYRTPKMHGMTKMQEYIKLFGSAMNFYGGPGEAAHKTFVKSAGQKTQRRVSKFAKQTANQYYNGLLTSYAMKHCMNEKSHLKQLNGSYEEGNMEDKNMVHSDDSDIEEESTEGNLNISLTGKYEFSVTEGVIEKIERELTVDVTWTFDDRKKHDNRKFRLNKNLVKFLHWTLVSSQERIGNVVGYTRAVITTLLTKERTIFYAHQCF